LPAVARTIGGFVNKARASWTSLRRTIESELAEADISAPIKQAGEELKRIGKEFPPIPGFTAGKGEIAKPATGTVSEPTESEPPKPESSEPEKPKPEKPEADTPKPEISEQVTDNGDPEARPVQDSND